MSMKSTGRDGRKPRRQLWIGLTVAGLVVAAWLVFAALQVKEAREEALAGIRQIESLQASLTVDSIGEGTELASLRDARVHFRNAERRADHPLLLPARILPVVGRQVRSASALADAAGDVTEIAERRFEAGRALLDRRQVDRAERVDYVTDIAALAEATRAELADIDLGPDDRLV